MDSMDSNQVCEDVIALKERVTKPPPEATKRSNVSSRHSSSSRHHREVKVEPQTSSSSRLSSSFPTPLPGSFSLPGAPNNVVTAMAPNVTKDSIEEKRRRMLELQASISAKLPTTTLPGFVNISGITTPALGLGVKPKENLRSVYIDEKGRTIDSVTGEVMQLSHHTPTLKANLRARHAEHFKQELQQAATKKTSLEQKGSAHFDSRVGLRISTRSRRQFHFHEPGKFVQMAQRLRAKSQLQRLQESVAEAAKRTGIASAAKLATIQPKRSVNEAIVPEVEWWDAYLLKTDAKQVSYNSVLPNGVPKAEMAHHIREEWITHLVEHPIRMKPPTQLDRVPEIPLMLTKKERKKLRRQNRLEVQKEQQEKVRLGLAAPAEPKVRLANLMRVLGTDAVQDPSKIEAFVRAQMDKRKKAHEAANAARKLTKDQVRQKKIRKTREDTSKVVHVAVYRVADLSNPSHKFKVETNCQQLLMTGFVALHRDCNVVVLEGGPKQQRKFKRLMLNRIRWNDHGSHHRKHQEQQNAASGGDGEKKYAATSPCVLVWEGTTGKRAFDKMQFKMCPTELFAREQFRKHDVEHYWDLAYSGAILEASDEGFL